jgi:hypothetical protein
MILEKHGKETCILCFLKKNADEVCLLFEAFWQEVARHMRVELPHFVLVLIQFTT